MQNEKAKKSNRVLILILLIVGVMFPIVIFKINPMVQSKTDENFKRKWDASNSISTVVVKQSTMIDSSSSEETICKDTEGQMRNGLLYLPNQQEPFTGKNLCKYKSGQKWKEGNYKDGKLDGKWTEWWENGQKSVEGNYKEGKKDGKWTGWYPDGQKYMDGNYKDGAPQITL
jgi:antitoxin component YwqK of YwqJK toxin-antitoxin module